MDTKSQTIFIVEDQYITSEYYRDSLKSHGFENIIVSNSGEDAIETLNRKGMGEKIGVCLIDIDLKGALDGIQVARAIRNSKFNIPVIFLTAHASKHLMEMALDVAPIAYLIKPIETLQLIIMINHALSQEKIEQSKLSSDEIFVKQESQFKRIPISEILYIKADRSYSTIITKSGVFTLAFPISKAIERVNNNEDLIRVHKSFVVNKNNVVGLSGESVELTNGESIPIGRAYKSSFIRFFRLI